MASACTNPLLTTTAYEIDPLNDCRWVPFLARHQNASVFHSAGWLRALNRTYGYRVAALTSSAPGAELRNALVYCYVNSWLTGRRIVSLPFSDHCAPLVQTADELKFLLARLRMQCDSMRGHYVEIRPVDCAGERFEGFAPAVQFCLHRLDLRPSLDELFHGFHTSSIRAKIRRALKQPFTCQEEHAWSLIDPLYQLSVMTRRRHRLPPQPIAWFRNLFECFGDDLKVHFLSYSGQPVAGIVTLTFGSTMIYKYGFSDAQFHRLGSMQLLLWNAIQAAKRAGLLVFDMGRSDLDNPGLITFKDRWGAVRTPLLYLRTAAVEWPGRTEILSRKFGKWIVSVVPDSILTAAGNLLYRHIG